MALTMEQLHSLLDPDEPNYVKAAAVLAPDDVPGLLDLVRGADPMLGSKAAYAISLIQDAAAVPAMDTAASSAHDVVRIAAAAALRNLVGLAVEPVAERLLGDADVGVRRSAIKSVRSLKLAALKPRLQSLADRDPDPGIRALASDALNP